MTEWIATTESGRIYQSVNGGIRVSRGGYYHNPMMRSFITGSVESWEELYALPEVDRPVVGERFFISTVGDAGWRISTEIVSVEDVE